MRRQRKSRQGLKETRLESRIRRKRSKKKQLPRSRPDLKAIRFVNRKNNKQIRKSSKNHGREIKESRIKLLP